MARCLPGIQFELPVIVPQKRHYVANATWLACIANHTVIPAKAGTYAAWVPAFAGMTVWLAMHASHVAFAT